MKQNTTMSKNSDSDRSLLCEFNRDRPIFYHDYLFVFSNISYNYSIFINVIDCCTSLII